MGRNGCEPNCGGATSWSVVRRPTSGYQLPSSMARSDFSNSRPQRDGKGACLATKNIGKPCTGKLYARFDEGASRRMNPGTRSSRGRRVVNERAGFNLNQCSPLPDAASHWSDISFLLYPELIRLPHNRFIGIGHQLCVLTYITWQHEQLWTSFKIEDPIQTVLV